MKNKKLLLTQSGFTLIELLIVIAIIGVLAAVILASLGSAQKKGTDNKIEQQLTNMKTQALLYTGPVGQSMIGDSGHRSSVPLGTAYNLFQDTTTTNSLAKLVNKLPAGTFVYFTVQNMLPSAGGKWIMAAETSYGLYCVDYIGASKAFIGTTPTTYAGITTPYPNFGSYSCN